MFVYQAGWSGPQAMVVMLVEYLVDPLLALGEVEGPLGPVSHLALVGDGDHLVGLVSLHAFSSPLL